MLIKRRVAVDKNEVGTVLLLQVPRSNDKKELAAEQLFANLHGLLMTPKGAAATSVNKRLSFEIAVKEKRIGFYVWVPNDIVGYVEEQIYAQYPSAQISKIADYTNSNLEARMQMVAELRLVANEALPIETFPNFEVDPLAAVTASLAQFEADEEAWIQMVITPAPERWHKRSERYVAGLRSGGTSATNILGAIWGTQSKTWTTPKQTEQQNNQARAAQGKSNKLAYDTTIRVVYRGNKKLKESQLRLQAITASFKQFNTTYLNSFSQSYLGSGNHLVDLYKQRTFGRVPYICNIEELATLYHLPHTNVETPNIIWANANTAEPPSNLPFLNDKLSVAERAELSAIAVTNFRGNSSMFGLLRKDRGRHLYILGQTGVGKSGLLELLTISDIYSPYGFAVIDPHGDYALNVLKRIPKERVNDVIYFNPADTDFPIAFNPMELSDPKLKAHASSELIGVLKRMFDAWGPRLEYILRYSILALLDYPGSTMLDITRILTDQDFRDDVISHVEDPVVRNFWTVEFASWTKGAVAEAIAPVLNKVGAFTANPMVRNIIGQPKSSFNIRQIMDNRKILIVNLSRGMVGEDNASILGALLVTKIQIAAMSRADIPVEARVPFYLYVDEFQNFATDSFTTILSEARKYALILTVANQYIAQMPQGVKEAVFGNVGSIIAFRMSADDSKAMNRYFEPHFSDHDLVHMNNRHFAINMTVGGEKVHAFSAASLNLPDLGADFSEQIIANSRRKFTFKKAEIESAVNKRFNAVEEISDEAIPSDLQEMEVVEIAAPTKLVSHIIKVAQPKGDEPPAILISHQIIQELDEDDVVRLH